MLNIFTLTLRFLVFDKKLVQILVAASRNDPGSFLVIQLWENLPLFVAVDANLFFELRDPQWRQSWHTWDGDVETLRQHVNTLT